MSDKGERTSTLAIAQRKGRCRAMKFHLNEMARAKRDSEVEVKRKALGLLAGEMMNGYPRDARLAPSSNALPVVNTAKGQRELNEARDAFRDTLQSVKGLGGKEAAIMLSKSCMACHSRFLQDKGQQLSVFGGNPLMH